jgi:hypothetical protein
MEQGSDCLYAYEALASPDNIRVLTLLPTEHRIECMIDQISINQGGYEALSYVWGSEEQSFSAVILGSDHNELGYLPLTENLKSALLKLRDTQAFHQKAFWIDQICINQQGTEKNSQVTLMGEIFKNADRVITFVGYTASESEEQQGLQMLNQLYDHFSPNCQQMADWRGLESNFARGLPVQNLPTALQLNGETDEHFIQGWSWLFKIACGEWTKRLWIVQEQLLNERLVMLHGTNLLSWEAVALMSMLFALEILPLFKDDKSWAMMSDFDFDIAISVYWLWRPRFLRITKNYHQLLTNIYIYETLKCRDLRDRVYALLAISCDSPALRIVPDYSENSKIDDVSRKVSIGHLLTYSSPDILSYACRWRGDTRNTSTNSLPSWSIDLSCITSFERPSMLPHQQWAPNPNTAPRNRFHLDNQSHNLHLVLKGSILDVILETIVDCAATTEVAIMNSVLQSCVHILLKLGFSMINAALLARTVVAERNFMEKSCNEQAAWLFWYIAYWSHRLDDNKSFEPKPLCELLLDNLEPLFPEPGDMPSMQNPRTLSSRTEMLAKSQKILFGQFQACESVLGRSFSITKNGRICNTMHNAREGDNIAALRGADRLYILRQVGDYYRVIGDAYVDGLMNGEFYENIDPSCEDRTIRLI